MQVVYAKEPFPTEVRATIFLAGPTPRDKSVPSWRPEALRLLAEAGFDGHVFSPEPRDGAWKKGYDEQVEWEEEGLNRADYILFWIPRDMATMPALTTNDEWGAWKNSGKVVLGTLPDPNNDRHTKYQEYYAVKYSVPHFKSLSETVGAAIAMTRPTGKRVIRKGGECQLPLCIWTLDSFQAWLQSQQRVGNRLDGARTGWTFRVGPHKSITFIWTIHVNVFIAAENRNKTNEIVLGRPDISTVVLWRRAPTLADTEVVLVKEFRSPARTPDGYIHELPGGSSKKNDAPIQVALDEVQEEAGILLTTDRLKVHPFRQIGGTLSSFMAFLFSAELTSVEMERVKMDSMAGVARGVVEDTERTYVEVVRVEDLLKNRMTDWATLGMVFAVLSEAMR